MALHARVPRRAPLDVDHLDALVHVVTAGLGTDGSLVDAALATGADGIVAVLLGAGHTPPGMLASLLAAAERVPVVAAVRPERGAILHTTYGFPGAEHELRASSTIPAAGLSPAAARIALMACLGAGLDRDGIAAVPAGDDV